MTEHRAGGEGLLERLRDRAALRDAGGQLVLASPRRRPCRAGRHAVAVHQQHRVRWPPDARLPRRVRAVRRATREKVTVSVLSSASSVAVTDVRQEGSSLVEVDPPSPRARRAACRPPTGASCCRTAAELVGLGQVCACCLVVTERHLDHPDRQRGERHRTARSARRKPSSAVDAARSAPSKSSTIGRIHETASCAALSRYGSSMLPVQLLKALERGERACRRHPPRRR